MANTYSQCYFHIVFAVNNRNALIKKSWKNELEKDFGALHLVWIPICLFATNILRPCRCNRNEGMRKQNFLNL